jgi:hypothetical protein
MTGPSIPPTGPDRERRTFSWFLATMTRELYVYRMAFQGSDWHATDEHFRDMSGQARSRRTRVIRAQRRIDDAVLARAAVIVDERRCAAVAVWGGKLRCEFSRGHGKVPGREARTASGQVVDTVPSTHGYDHGAPGSGVWWNEEEHTS